MMTGRAVMTRKRVPQEGDKVLWRGSFGSLPPRAATVVGVGEKNGRLVYDLDNGHRAYGYQLEVVRCN